MLLATANRFRRTTAGVALLLTPFAFATSEFLGRDSQATAAATLTDIAAHRSQVEIASLMSIAVAVLFLPGTIGITHMIRHRGVTYANLAAVCIGYGLIAAHAALGGVNLIFAQMADPNLDAGAMASLYDAITNDAVVGAPLLLGHVIFAAGVALLAVALLRSHVGPRWAAWSVLGWVVSDIALAAVPVEHLDSVVSDTFALIGLVGLGMHLLRSSDSDWADPPSPHLIATKTTDKVSAQRTPAN